MTNENKTEKNSAKKKNGSLKEARKNKNDEFYTRMTDVENELRHYKTQFKGKSVLCNCDDPEWSSFWKYFVLNFDHLGLSKLVSTHYKKDGSPSCKMEYDGTKDAQGNPSPVRTPLSGDGDFRSPECVALLEGCDVVVTNPPFSLFKEYVAMLDTSGKKFLVIGNFNAVSYKEIFRMVKSNKLWLGVSPRSMDFINIEGKIKTVNAAWFTNLDNKKRHESLPLYKTYEGNEATYPKYDNYDAINVDKVKDIPVDYFGEMGVPITFLDKHNLAQFQILDINPHFFSVVDSGKPKPDQLRISGRKDPYARLLIKRKKDTP
ncbi:adenine-specific methyltransferase EcoRI family protein [Azonexus fungiphilus]|uniref:adenine-specific methyltransferase EcoRI family protein n=1 Tax=Azonexus fungiphilus TaxID=146940 RepID=UPI00156B4D29|nr:adenine-specific methyltransferase EcoRI family protein [Azonexus fungiphilus]NHC08598.1 modification methylase [Azonexus fungiphilus]